MFRVNSGGGLGPSGFGDVRQTSQGGYGRPGAEDVDWHGGVFEQRVAKQEAEYVEHVMPVVGQCEGVDDGVVVNDCQHNRGDWDKDGKPR